MGRHANGDTPTGVLFIRPPDPTFRRAAGGRKTGSIPTKNEVERFAATTTLPAQRPPSRDPHPSFGAAGVPVVTPRPSLPLWTKLCIIIGAVLLVLGFGGLGAAYAVSQVGTSAAGNDLVQR